jgi:Leucine-rich repeat (LRR) protein
MRFLNLSNKKLTKIPDDLPHDLEELDLSFNKIEKIENLSPNLHTLFLS